MQHNLKLDEIQKIQLNILLEVADFCDKNGITYFLTAGTLIGALRHQGFIPWDDDIDILMFRPDYEKFISIFNKRKNAGTKKVFATGYKNYPYAFAKVSDENTVLVESENLNKYFQIGVNIDVFPLDYLGDDLSLANKFVNYIYRYGGLMDIKNISLDRPRPWYKQTFIKIAQMCFKIFSYKYLISKINQIARKYENQTNSKYIGQIVLKAKGEREILERKWFSSTIELLFENHLFKAPVGYDAYLRRLFGNYMQLPPPGKRVSTHYIKAYYKGEIK